jgi:glycosyltransferase involved in cell wall biosynthesis
MLSVVIPTLNNERTLVRTLSALVPAAATGVVREVIIADGGSTDATLEVADVAGCNITSGDAALARRLRAAATNARGPWLMFLQPGAILEPAWADEADQFVRHVDLTNAERAAAFRRGIKIGGSTSPLREAMSMLRSSLVRRVEPAQGLLIAKSHYERLGGHRDAAANTERDLVARIGRRIVVLRSGVAMLAGPN